MCHGIVRTQLDGALELRDRVLELKIVVGKHGRGSMGFAQTVIEFQGPLHRGFRLRNRISRSSRTVVGKKEIGISQANIGEDIIRIFQDSLIEIIDGLAQVRPGPFVPKISALQVNLVSFTVGGRSLGHGGHFRSG